MDFCVKDIPCAGEYDLLIAGSGMGGISAAAAAAEDGLKVGMIEAFGEPGGIPVNGRLGSISGYSRKGAVAVGGTLAGIVGQQALRLVIVLHDYVFRA